MELNWQLKQGKGKIKNRLVAPGSRLLSNNFQVIRKTEVKVKQNENFWSPEIQIYSKT